MKRKETSQLNVKVSVSIYNHLKSSVGKGKISEFVESLIVKEIGSSERRVEQEYRECYANPRILKEAKQWEKAEVEGWRNFEENKKEKAKK